METQAPVSNGRSRDWRMLLWLRPGMHVKRWLLLLFLGVVLMGLGVAYLLREAYLTYTFPGVAYYLTIQFIPRFLRGLIFAVLSVAMIGTAVWKLNHSLLEAVQGYRGGASLVDRVYTYRFRNQGPRVVVIGGGTGLSTLLRGLKQYTTNLTTIVTVADDGGSSGRLRRDMGVLPPGDIRKNIAALADEEQLMTRLFQYRFDEGSGDLEGHSFGNLFIVAMTAVTGSFEEAVRATSRVLNVRGTILPSTLEDLTLVAEVEGVGTVRGESAITERGGRVKAIRIEPADAEANQEAVQALLAADMIIVGPGSLYTSVLPNFLVRGVRDAAMASPAFKAYVCNVATQHGETDRFGVADHLGVLEREVGKHFFNAVLANSNLVDELPPQWHSEPVRPDPGPVRGTPVVLADVVSDQNRYRHDPDKLATALMQLYDVRVRVPLLAPTSAEPQAMAMTR